LEAKIKFGENPSNRAHLERWIASADDQIWRRIVEKLLVNYPYQISPDLIEGNYLWIIRTGLLARRAAEVAFKKRRDLRYEMAYSRACSGWVES
jgi:hypothetical protein